MDQVGQSKVTEEPRATYNIPHAARCQLPWHANRCEKSALSPHERSEINCRAVVSYVSGIENVASAGGRKRKGKEV